MMIAGLSSRKRLLAGLAGIGVAALTVGSAGAVNPIMEGPNIDWAGSVAQIWDYVPGGSFRSIYQVPSGVNFLLTDLIISNSNDVPVVTSLFTGRPLTATSCGVENTRLFRLWVRPKETLVLPLNTGIGFSSGQVVCVYNVDHELNYNARGYLFKPGEP